MDISQKKISAIIACYKEAKTIPFMYERLTKMFKEVGCKYEIIFVDDGSTDDSPEVLKKLAVEDPHVVVVTHARNFGSQSCFISGMSVSSGDAVVPLDGDLQDPPEIIPQFIEKWKEGYDVVYGERAKREGKILLRIGYRLFYRLFSKLSYIKIPLDAGDFSLIDRKVVDHIISLPEKDIFLRGLRAWVGYKQIGVPFYRPERMFGVTTNNFLKNVRWAKKGIFSFSYEPLEFIFYVASILFAVTFIAIIFYIAEYFLNPDAPRGITTIIVLILFFGSIQLLSLSVLGEYLGKIFEEVKNRPKYIVKEVLNRPIKK